MMNSLLLGALTFLIVSPAISSCDGDLNKASGEEDYERNREANSDGVAKLPLNANHLQNFHNEDGSDNIRENLINELWPFYRQLRAPSGFMGVRGKKEFDEVC